MAAWLFFGTGCPHDFDRVGRGPAQKDRGQHDVGRPDGLPPDHSAPDFSKDTWIQRDKEVVASDLAVDAKGSCPDVYESNDSCSQAKSIGSIVEGNAWVKKTATISPAANLDWFRAMGKEASHTCIPHTAQTYYFRVAVDVPTGREFKVCVQEGACTGTPVCKDNKGNAGPIRIEVKYKVSGTCGLNDDTVALILVQPLEAKKDCTPYSVSFNYNDK